MYQLSFSYRFEAAHRFTKSCADACMTPHGHTWRARLTLASRESELDDNDMVTEFSKLKTSWKALVDGTLDHSFLAHHQDPLLFAMRQEIPTFREVLFPGDPTTELLARLLATKAQQIVAHEGHDRVVVKQVHVQETETNAVAFDVGADEVLPLLVNGCEGWWTDPNPTSRYCRAVDDIES